MSDAVIACFQEEFTRFHTLLVKQIDACPDELWTRKVGGYVYWQQLLHAFAYIDLYILPPDAQAWLHAICPPAVVMLAQEPETHLTKQDLKNFAAAMKKLADAFIADMSADKLPLAHGHMTTMLKAPKTNQHALMGLIRHANYHLGSCDAILRQHGIPGVL